MPLQHILSRFIYYPDPEWIVTPGRLGLEAEEIHLSPEPDVQLHAWFFPRTNAQATLLFCHGNAGNVSHRLDNVSRLLQAGFQVAPVRLSRLRPQHRPALRRGSLPGCSLCLDAPGRTGRHRQRTPYHLWAVAGWGRSHRTGHPRPGRWPHRREHLHVDPHPGPPVLPSPDA